MFDRILSAADISALIYWQILLCSPFLERDINSGHGNCGDNIKSPAGLQLSSQTSQGEDERDGRGKKYKSQVKFWSNTQLESHGGRTGVAKTKSKRPASPYHISSMTFYQKKGAKEFTRCNNEDEKTFEELAAVDENNVSSSDLRTKWFLSTNQWPGFVPLQIPGTDSIYNEETSEHDNQPAEDVIESMEMSSTVSESLEKMKENHSLFYKIACDISISDTDITKNNENVNSQISSKPEEEEKLLITESLPDDEISIVGRFCGQDSKESSCMLSSGAVESSLSADNKLQHSKLESHNTAELISPASPAREMQVYEEIQRIGREGSSSRERQLKVKETNRGVSAQYVEYHQALEECEKIREEKSDRKMDAEQSEEGKTSSSLQEENEETVKERGNDNSISPSSSACEGGSVIRSASFGKARVTVLRTSL